MGHYLNDYFEARALIGVDKKRVSKVMARLLDAESEKSSIMAKADCLKQAIKDLEGKLSSEKKRRKGVEEKRRELDNAAIEVSQKLFDDEARLAAVLHEGVEAYKLSNECLN